MKAKVNTIMKIVRIVLLRPVATNKLEEQRHVNSPIFFFSHVIVKLESQEMHYEKL